MVNYDKFIIWLPTYKKHKDVSELNYKNNKETVPLFKNSDLKELNKTLKENNTLLILKFHPAEDLSDFKDEEYSHLKLWKNEELIKRDKRYIEQYIIEAIKSYSIKHNN